MRGDLMWTCPVWAKRSTPDNFREPSRFNSTTGEQKGITQTIYTDSEPPSQMPNSLMPSAKLSSANLPFFTSLVWRGRGSNHGLRTPSGRSNHYATQGRWHCDWSKLYITEQDWLKGSPIWPKVIWLLNESRLFMMWICGTNFELLHNRAQP